MATNDSSSDQRRERLRRRALNVDFSKPKDRQWYTMITGNKKMRRLWDAYTGSNKRS
jgi:hypothetical protein